MADYIGQNQGSASALQQNWNAIQSAAVPPTPMGNISHRLTSAVDEAAKLAERLLILECRVTGGGNVIGKDAGVSVPRPMPVGHIGQMNTSVDDLADRLNRAADSVSRLLDAI